MNFPSMYPKGERPTGKGRFFVGDLESVGLIRATRKPDDIHILTLEDYFNGEVFIFFDPLDKRQNPTPLEMEGEQDGYIEDGVRMLMESEAFAFQNAVGFDAHVFENCFPWWSYNYLQPRHGMKNYDLFPFKLMDTMIVSQLTYPDRPLDHKAYSLGLGNMGSHSIASHGIRMGRHKPEHDDWSKLDDAMLHRNVEDVAIGRDFHRYLMEGDWAEQVARGVNQRTGLGIHRAYSMEIQVAFMIARQEQRGFRLDMAKAHSDWTEIDGEMADIAKAVDPHIPPRVFTDPYSFDKLKPRYDSLLKSSLFNERDKGELAAWGILDTAAVKSLFNGIHKHMLRLEDSGRIGKASTMWDITTKSGDYGKRLQKYYPEMRGSIFDTPDPLVAGPFTPVTFEDVGLGNLDYIKEKVLYPYGWLGVNLSESEQEWLDDNGDVRYPWSGKIDEDSMSLWASKQEVPEWATKIVSYYVLRSRRSQILNPKDVAHFDETGEWPRQKNGSHGCKGLMAVAYNKDYNLVGFEYYAKFGHWPDSYDEEWRVPAAAFSIGTNTFRMRHRFVVNIPSRGLRPLRHLFIAKNGYMILGCDGAGLELRMLAHFMADDLYQEIILHGDIHTHNQLKASLPTRDMAKTFIYAFLYGSGIANLARVTGLSLSHMEDCIRKFKEELPALAILIERCEAAGKKFGYLHAIDGRWGRIRRKSGKVLVHTVLNVLLQMTGSLVMKYGECMAEDDMIAEGVGLDEKGYPAFVANQHDEVQMEVKADEVEELSYTLAYSTMTDNERKAIKEVWDAEEKREHIDELGRMWSAPRKDSASDGVITVSRRYHRAGNILTDNFTKAGIYLKMRCPLAGEYKIGHSWGDTH